MNKAILTALMLTCLIAIGCNGGGDGLSEVEPNNHYDQTQSISVPLGGLTGSVEAENDPGDYFSFHLEAGQTIRGTLSYANGASEVDIIYHSYDQGEQWDDTWEQNGQVITSTYTAPNTGIHIVEVYAYEWADPNPATSYVLTIEVI